MEKNNENVIEASSPEDYYNYGKFQLEHVIKGQDDPNNKITMYLQPKVGRLQFDKFIQIPKTLSNFINHTLLQKPAKPKPQRRTYDIFVHSEQGHITASINVSVKYCFTWATSTISVFSFFGEFKFTVYTFRGSFGCNAAQHRCSMFVDSIQINFRVII